MKKTLMIIGGILILAILVYAVFVIREPQEAPKVYASIADGTTATCIRGTYTWNYFGGSVTADSASPYEFEYTNENTLLVKPGEQITFSNSSIDFTSYKFNADEVKYYDKNKNEIDVAVDELSIYQDVKHFTLKAPEEDGTYIYSLRLNYYQKGEATYGLKVVVSSEPIYIVNDIVKYKDTYIGDAPSVNNILGKLPYAKYKDSIVLRTATKPYELIVRYEGIELTREELFNNTVALFTLITNVDVITYSIIDTDTKIVYNRNEIETIMGRDLQEYANDTDLWVKEVFYKEKRIETFEKIDLYKIVISDAISSINGLINEYIALDTESFTELNDIDRKKLLEYAGTLSDTIIDSNIEGLKKNGMYEKDSLRGTLIRLKTVQQNGENYSIIIEKIKSEKNVVELIYEAKIENNNWVLIKK